MKKQLYLLLLLSLTINQIHSQKTLSASYPYKVSEPYRVFDAKEKLYFSRGNEVLAVKLDGKEILLQKFDSEKPAFVKEKKYENYFPRNYSFEQILEINEKYYFFYSSWDGDNDKEQLFAVEIDFSAGEFIGEQKLVFQVNGKVAGTLARVAGGWSLAVEDKFDFFQANDKKSVLIQYRKKPEVKRDTKSFDIIGLLLFDGNLKKLSGNEVTMPYTERRMNNLDYQLDKNGNFYLLEKVFHDDSNDDKKSRKDKVANYHVELLTIKSGANKFQISKLENNDKFINKIWLFDTGRDYLICAGFYSNGKGDFNDCDGIAAFKINADGTFYDKVFHEIPLEIINQYESDKTKKKNEKKERKGDNAQFADLVLDEIAVGQDGSIVLIGEQFFTVTTYSAGGMGNMGGQARTTYHYRDILVSKINPDGTLGWMKKVPKTQVGGRGKGGMSYKYFNANSNHYVIFLDNVKNIDLPLEKTPAVHSDGQGGYLTAVKISDSDGALSKGSILNARDVEDFKIYQFSTDRIVKTSDSSFLLEVYKKKKEDIVIKVDLK